MAPPCQRALTPWDPCGQAEGSFAAAHAGRGKQVEDFGFLGRHGSTEIVALAAEVDVMEGPLPVETAADAAEQLYEFQDDNLGSSVEMAKGLDHGASRTTGVAGARAHVQDRDAGSASRLCNVL